MKEDERDDGYPHTPTEEGLYSWEKDIERSWEGLVAEDERQLLLVSAAERKRRYVVLSMTDLDTICANEQTHRLNW